MTTVGHLRGQWTWSSLDDLRGPGKVLFTTAVLGYPKGSFT